MIVLIQMKYEYTIVTFKKYMASKNTVHFFEEP